VQEVALAGRGVYERFGRPVAVLGPGLHLGLPWPLGRVVAVENGVVHALATGQAGPVATEASADGPAPEGANRLWDATHARDNTQVIASGSGARQNFQVVNMDVRFIYRLGLTDADALAATYHSADVPGLIRDTASRVLVHTLASRTLDGLLGDDRSGLAQTIGAAVQADLRKVDSGVEILATVIEAIHPPAGAANAYHGVQAAQIAAQSLVARERGAAAATTSAARLNAFDIQTQAQASARESEASAQVAQTLFEAERAGYAQAGYAFVFERYLTQLRQGLAQAQLLVLDHRLGGRDASGSPTLDLRSFLAPADPTPPRANR
jgi:regulator of protease activity HflC (stomatin/prohibitin superfamily)